MATLQIKQPAEVFVLDAGKLKRMHGRSSSRRQTSYSIAGRLAASPAKNIRQWDYTEGGAQLVRFTRNPENDRLDIAVSKSFTGVVRVPMRDMLDRAVPGAYDTLTFRNGALSRQGVHHRLAPAAISQLGDIEQLTSVARLGSLRPEVTPTSAVTAHRTAPRGR